jgi:hypothetical protein
MSGLVNGVLAGTGAFKICNRFDFWTASCDRGIFFGRFNRTKPILPHFGMVSAAFGILGRG